MRKRPLLLALCVFWIGIVWGKTRELWLVFLFIAVLVYELAGWLKNLFMYEKHQKRIVFDVHGVTKSKFQHDKLQTAIIKYIPRSVMLLGVFIAGSYCMHHNLEFRENYLSKLTDGDEITIWGEIYKDECLDETTYRIYLTDCYVSFKNTTLSKQTESENQNYMPCNQVMVYVSSTDYPVGTILKIKGKFHNFSTARNEGNFDSQSFYQSQKIDFYMEADSLEKVGENLSVWKQWVIELREKIGEVYSRFLPTKYAGMLKGIVLGDKSELDEELKSLFTISGIVHILSVSGLHVSVLGRGLYQFLRNRKWGFFFSGITAGIFLYGYGYMTGNSPSAVRAIGMMFLFMLAQLLGRTSDMLNSMGGVVLLLLIENPFLTEYSGLWFSVIALVGVAWPGEYFSRVEEGKDDRNKLNNKEIVQILKGKARKIISNSETEEEKKNVNTKARKNILASKINVIIQGFWMGLGVTLTTLPIVAMCYFEVPIYSSILNCVVIPLLTPTFICGVFGGVIGTFLPAVGELFLKPSYFVLWLYEALCEWMMELPFASLITGEPSFGVIVAYYLFFGIGALWFKKQTEQEEASKWFGVKKLIFAVLCFALIFIRKDEGFEINFLDVGQGDGIHIAMGDNDFFIDGGSSSVSEVGKYRILPYLKSNAVSEIDYWFVSHTDEDHVSGLMEILQSGYSVKHLVLPAEAPKDENYEKLVAAAKANDTVICFMKEGDVIQCEEGTFHCLYAGEPGAEDANENCLVLELEWEDKRALFTGDISAEVEARLVEEGVFHDVWLYKAAHHGSKNSNSAELLEVIRPEVAVISCSSTNVYGHPAPETIERLEAVGCEIFYTMEQGQVTIQMNY